MDPQQSNTHWPPESLRRWVCVGDVHDMWSKDDEICLRLLDPDMILFVGDFGNENLEVVEKICSISPIYRNLDNTTLPDWDVALVFGNHDAFFTASPLGVKNSPYKRQGSPDTRVLKQLEAAKYINVSYKCMDVPEQSVSIIGGRPFSWGGPHWKHGPFFQRVCGVTSLEHSESRINKAIDSAQNDASIVFLAHSGPSGLGSRPESICGKDFGTEPEGDWGDIDLRKSIEHARKAGRRVPLVVFGHMHRELNHLFEDMERIMIVAEPDVSLAAEKISSDDTDTPKTVMLNTAVVPRILPDLRNRSNSRYNNPNLHHFNMVVFIRDKVAIVYECWVSSIGQVQNIKVMYHDDKICSLEHVQRDRAELLARNVGLDHHQQAPHIGCASPQSMISQ